jgi:crossover junction endodeoxyribonuclease RuvC
MTILGIDPGIGRVGWGIIELRIANCELRDYGCLETSSKELDHERLVKIHEFITEKLQENKPDAVAVEELFFSANAKTAISVGQARGVILLTAALQKIPLFSYTPLQVKQALTGYGRAEKGQIQQMVKTLLGLKEIPKPDDAADALAIALCHAFSYKMNSQL